MTFRLPQQPTSEPRQRGVTGRPGQPAPRAGAARARTIAGYTALAIASFLVAALTFVVVAQPFDFVREELTQRFRDRTGGTLTIGATSVSFFPRAAVILSDVALSAEPGAGRGLAVTMDRLELKLSLWNLLSRRIEAESIALHRPVIDLRSDATDRRGDDRPDRPNRADEGRRDAVRADEAKASPPGRAAERLEKFAWTTARLIDGTIRYRDGRAGSGQELRDVDLLLTRDAGRLSAKGSLVWRGEKLTVDASLAPFQSLFGTELAQASLDLSGEGLLRARFNGRASLEAAEGTFSLAADRTIPGWRPLRGIDGNRPLTVSGALKADKGRLTLSGLEGRVGDATLAGSLDVELRSPRPFVRGTLQVSELDMGTSLLRPRAERRARTPAGTHREEHPEGGGTPKAGAKTPEKAADWSDKPIDPGLLALADANLSFEAERVIYKGVTAGRSRLSVTVEDRVARIALDEMAAYGGRVAGLLTLDGTGEALAASARLKLAGVSALPLLKDSLRFAWLEGRADLDVEVAGQGLSERQLVASLNGRAALSIADGSIFGLDAGKAMQLLEQGRIGGIAFSPSEKTSFRELAATFLITNGVAENQDLKLIGPDLHVAGDGKVDLAAREVDYIVRLKIALRETGQSGTLALEGLEVPIHIQGPWENPSLAPDLKEIVKNPEQAAEALKRIRRNLKSQDVQDAIKGLLGGTSENEKRIKPRELIEKLLRKP